MSLNKNKRTLADIVLGKTGLIAQISKAHPDILDPSTISLFLNSSEGKNCLTAANQQTPSEQRAEICALLSKLAGFSPKFALLATLISPKNTLAKTKADLQAAIKTICANDSTPAPDAIRKRRRV